jgi:hypothetical protein
MCPGMPQALPRRLDIPPYRDYNPPMEYEFGRELTDTCKWGVARSARRKLLCRLAG